MTVECLFLYRLFDLTPACLAGKTKVRHCSWYIYKKGSFGTFGKCWLQPTNLCRSDFFSCNLDKLLEAAFSAILTDIAQVASCPHEVSLSRPLLLNLLFQLKVSYCFGVELSLLLLLPRDRGKQAASVYVLCCRRHRKIMSLAPTKTTNVSEWLNIDWGLPGRLKEVWKKTSNTSNSLDNGARSMYVHTQIDYGNFSFA